MTGRNYYGGPRPRSGMATEETTEIPPPGFVIPGIRCALEMVMVGVLVLLIGLPTTNPFYLGWLVVAALISMTVVLFWSLNRQMETWIARARHSGQQSSE